MKHFNVSEVAASLGLALYVLGCKSLHAIYHHSAKLKMQDGLGPLLFSPLSEIAYIGRNPVYISTFFVFVILSIGAAVCDSFAGLVILRFLQGFFGSPCLATGAATLSDMV